MKEITGRCHVEDSVALLSHDTCKSALFQNPQTFDYSHQGNFPPAFDYNHGGEPYSYQVC